MRQNKPIKTAKILKRYKRFLADVELENGEIITVHTANTGSMKTCWEPGWQVIISDSQNTKRKYQYSLELTHNGDTWIGINTGLANDLAEEVINNGNIEQLSGYKSLKREKKIGKSRLDIFLSDSESGKKDCFVEVKNVTLKDQLKATFPDAVSERGQKHLDELINLKNEGHRSCMLYIVQREDVEEFSPANKIDPIYTQKLKEAVEAGVEVYVCQFAVQPDKIEFKRLLPLKL